MMMILLSWKESAPRWPENLKTPARSISAAARNTRRRNGATGGVAGLQAGCDGGIEMAWLQEAATSTRDSKPTENAYGYFLKMVRETRTDHGIDFNQAAADLATRPRSFGGRTLDQAFYREGEPFSGEPAHHDGALAFLRAKTVGKTCPPPIDAKTVWADPGVVAG